MIVQAVVQMLLVSALKYGRTIAGESRVFDSLAGNILEDKEHQLAPIIIVNGEDTVYSNRCAFGGKANHTFLIQFAVLYADKASADQPSKQAWKLPYSDPGAQYYLARLERDIFRALLPENSDFSRVLGIGFSDWQEGVKSTLGGSRQKGVRFAARQLTLSGFLMMEPAPGEPIPEWLDDALTLLEADTATARIASQLRADLEADPYGDLSPETFALYARGSDSAHESEILGLQEYSGGELIWLSIDGVKGCERVLD